MTSKSSVSWGQQAHGGGRAERESPFGPFYSLMTAVTPQSQQGHGGIAHHDKLSRVPAAFPHSLLSGLGQVT